jgi:hypothetical protein
MPRLEPLRVAWVEQFAHARTENLFEGTSDEERDAEEVVAGAIAGGSFSA